MTNQRHLNCTLKRAMSLWYVLFDSPGDDGRDPGIVALTRALRNTSTLIHFSVKVWRKKCSWLYINTVMNLLCGGIFDANCVAWNRTEDTHVCRFRYVPVLIRIGSANKTKKNKQIQKLTDSSVILSNLFRYGFPWAAVIKSTYIN